MTYFPDLTPYAYFQLDLTAPTPRDDLLNVGWLDPAHEFPTAPPDRAFVARLGAICRRRSVNPMRGWHACA